MQEGKMTVCGGFNTIHKNKLKMDKRSKCKTRNYKTPRGEHRQNTLRHKSQQDPL